MDPLNSPEEDAATATTVELNPSILGSKEYWDEAYAKEIENFEEFGDEGEIWFGNQSVKRIVNWIKKSNIPKDSRIIDLGCGNGYTCCQLAEEGFLNLTGIDYSENAIKLAEKLSEKENFDIEYKIVDILNDEHLGSEKYFISIDKGTYDAISLMKEDAKAKRYLYKKYLISIMQSGGYFIIASCNWTESELKEFFLEDNQFELVEEIKSAANFVFGGRSGSKTTSIVFKYK